ncbi:MAG: metallophosphoesterase [Magnetococcales bacterium]|nr:metallophosphoesterase [Magnetococcales bacterium]
MSEIKILHVSDVHIYGPDVKINNFTSADNLLVSMAKYLSSHCKGETIKRVNQAIINHASDVDYIVITGDLISCPTDFSLEAAEKFVKGGRLIHAKLDITLQPLPLDKLIIAPGNHDTYDRSGVYSAPTNGNFEEFFSQHEFPHFKIDCDRKVGFLIADFNLEYASDASAVTPGASLGQGKVYKCRIKELERHIREIRRQCVDIRHLILVSHYPPLYNYALTDWGLNLLKEETLLSFLEENKVGVVLAGHSHNSRKYSIRDGNVHVLCAGAAGVFPNACMHKITINLPKTGNITSGTIGIKHLNWNKYKSDFSD